MAIQDPTVVLPAPLLPDGQRPDDKWKREFEAFQRLLPGLVATHAGQYVVIHNGQVVASGTDDVALALSFFKEHGSIPIHVGLVSLQPQAVVRVPHYRPIATTGSGA